MSRRRLYLLQHLHNVLRDVHVGAEMEHQF